MRNVTFSHTIVVERGTTTESFSKEKHCVVGSAPFSRKKLNKNIATGIRRIRRQGQESTGV